MTGLRHDSFFSPNAGKYGREITLYLDTFHAVTVVKKDHKFNWKQKKVVDGKSRLVPKKIKETKHYQQQVIVTYLFYTRRF